MDVADPEHTASVRIAERAFREIYDGLVDGRRGAGPAGGGDARLGAARPACSSLGSWVDEQTGTIATSRVQVMPHDEPLQRRRVPVQVPERVVCDV